MYLFTKIAHVNHVRYCTSVVLSQAMKNIPTVAYKIICLHMVEGEGQRGDLQGSFVGTEGELTQASVPVVWDRFPFLMNSLFSLIRSIFSVERREKTHKPESSAHWLGTSE